MILLDTTVLAYAVGADHPLRGPSRALLAAHGSGRIHASTTVEVVQEFLHLRSRRRSRDEAVERTRELADAFDLLMVTADDLTRGATLFLEHPQLGAFDAVLAAVALSRGADALVSADRAFAHVAGLSFLDLADPQLEQSVIRASTSPRS